ncbi:MAG: DUF881 domain-containing protein [Marmoricola sp.]
MSKPDTPAPQSPPAEPPAEPTAYQRLRRALLHPGRGQISAAVLLVILGIAGVTQVRLAGSDDEYAGMRQADLVQALNGLQAASRRNEQDIRDLQDTRSSLQDNNDKTDAALRQARDEMVTLGILAGTSTATGPGVRITVTVDPDGRLSLNNLLDGIEELRDAGAEAMEINDAVRVVAQTSFETADNGINVDGRVLTAPFVIDAIGDPDSLDTALNFPGGFIDDLRPDDAHVHVKKSQKIQVTVLRRAVQPRYAESP